MFLLPIAPEALSLCHLDAKDLPAVAEARSRALEHAGRVEAEPVLPRLAEVFYESPFTDPRRWAEDLCALQGPDYLAAWLRQVIAENRILAMLEPHRVQGLLARCCPDYRVQLVNLCEPAAVNLLGRAVLGMPPLALTLTDDHRAALRHAKAAPLHEAAERLAKEYGMDAPTLHAAAATLAARIPQGHLEQVFL